MTNITAIVKKKLKEIYPDTEFRVRKSGPRRITLSMLRDMKYNKEEVKATFDRLVKEQWEKQK